MPNLGHVWKFLSRNVTDIEFEKTWTAPLNHITYRETVQVLRERFCKPGMFADH